jgi:hypothetical protein
MLAALLLASAISVPPNLDVPLHAPTYDEAQTDVYLQGQEVWRSRNSAVSPLLKPPTNLSPGDGQAVVAKKVANSRLNVVGDMLRDDLRQAARNVGVGQDMARSLEGLSSRVSKAASQGTTLDTGLCSLRSSVGYDVNSGTATGQATCEIYQARVVYRPFENYYEASVFKVMDTGTKVGFKSTQFSNSGLVFVEGSW